MKKEEKEGKNHILNHRYEDLINDLRGKAKKRVLFVCLGNICRSPAAEGVLRRIVEENGADARWEIDSAGTGGWHVGELPDRRMRVHARERGLDLNHRCRKVKVSDFDDFDIIVPMDDNNQLELRRLAPSLEAARKIIPMAAFVDDSFHYDYVPDPYYEGAEGFELVLDLLENGCSHMFEMLGK